MIAPGPVSIVPWKDVFAPSDALDGAQNTLLDSAPPDNATCELSVGS